LLKKLFDNSPNTRRSFEERREKRISRKTGSAGSLNLRVVTEQQQLLPATGTVCLYPSSLRLAAGYSH